jgi:hypothetical protein
LRSEEEINAKIAEGGESLEFQQIADRLEGKLKQVPLRVRLSIDASTFLERFVTAPFVLATGYVRG